MWSTSPCHKLLVLRRHYFTDYSALASNSHLAESNVEDANHCSVIGRGEATALLFYTSRSGIIETLNENSKKHKEEKLKRNKIDGTAGVAENQIRTRVLGSTRSEHAIMLLKKRHASIETDLHLQENEREWKRLREGISNNEAQFFTERVKVKVEHFNMKLHLEKAPNVLQRLIGIDTTHRAAGRILYSFLKNDCDILLLKAELTYRGLATEGGGWKKICYEDLLIMKAIGRASGPATRISTLITSTMYEEDDELVLHDVVLASNDNSSKVSWHVRTLWLF